MKTNKVLEKLRAGKPALGCFLGLGSPNVAELMAYAGYEWLTIETEHNGLDSAEIEHMIRAIDGTDTLPLVRIPSSNRVYIQRALDMGAMGVVVPMVKTVEEAECIVRATRLPPEGIRSWGPLRGSHYGFDTEDYLRRINNNILVVLIVETREAVDNLDAIAAVPGVDVLTLGPWDLSLSLGLNPLDLPLPDVDAVLSRMVEVARTGQVAAGCGVDTPEELRELYARGVMFLGFGTDYSLLANAAQQGLRVFQE